MPSTTSRLGLSTTLGSDNVSAFPAIHASDNATLDNCATYYEGTLGGRPAAGAHEHGRLYRTTDAGGETLTWTDGTSWLPLGLIPVSTSMNVGAISGQAVITTGSSAVTVTAP